MLFFWLIILAMLAFDALWWWWADRRLRVLRRARAWRTSLAVFMALQLLCFLGIMVTRLLGYRALIPVSLVAGVYIWHLLVLPLATVALLVGTGAWAAAGVVRRIGNMLGAWGTPHLPPTDLSNNTGPTRRQVLAAGLASVPPLFTVGAAGTSLTEIGQFRIRPMTVRIPNLPAALDGLTIAHLSDVHAGRFTGDAAMAHIVDRVNALNADLVLMTGDLIDHSLADLPAALEMMRALKSRHGLFLCEGNHDLIEDRYEFERRVRDAGLPLLLNESQLVTIRNQLVQIIGLKWGIPGQRRESGIQQNFSRIQPSQRTDVFPILLAHHPHAFDAAASARIPLTLAGHTHGGQFMLNEHLGAGSVMFKYWSGLYQQADSSLIVSNGVGNWFPLRINAPAEIVHVTLHPLVQSHAAPA